MPRMGEPRTIPAERKLAEMVRYLRERRGWSLDTAARLMTGVGVPMQVSTLSKLEAQRPPRRITVNELQGFALIFGLPVEEVLNLSPVEYEDQHLSRLLLEAVHVRQDAERAMLAWLAARRAVGAFLRQCDRETNQLAGAITALDSPELDRMGWPVEPHSVMTDGTVEHDPIDPSVKNPTPKADAASVRDWLDGR